MSAQNRYSTEGRQRQMDATDRLRTRLVERRLKSDGTDQSQRKSYCEERLTQTIDGLSKLVVTTFPASQFENRPAMRAARGRGRDITEKDRLPPISWANVLDTLDELFQAVVETTFLIHDPRKLVWLRNPRGEPLSAAYDQLWGQYQHLKGTVETLPGNTLIQEPQRLGVRMTEEQLDQGAGRKTVLAMLPKTERKEFKKDMKSRRMWNLNDPGLGTTALGGA